MNQQAKLQRLLRLLMLLCGKRYYSISELSERIGNSERTIFRYIESFELAGFVAERSHGGYRLQTNCASSRQLQRLLQFTEEEADLLHEGIQYLEGNIALREQLSKKLDTLYIRQISATSKKEKIHLQIQQLNQAIKSRVQVVLEQYYSNHSKTVANRPVEPFEFTEEFEAIWCYEPASQQCKQFKLARITNVVTTNMTWVKEKRHAIPFVDVFGIAAAKKLADVRLKLSLAGYNLLNEEFPSATKQIQALTDNYCIVTIPVASYEGIGRFILGLWSEVAVLAPIDLQNFLRNKIKAMNTDTS